MRTDGMLEKLFQNIVWYTFEYTNALEMKIVVQTDRTIHHTSPSKDMR